MGYPTSVYSPATKNTGDTVQASHVNDLDTEVAALENALINGPITLQASTIATVSVTGGSTFAVRPVMPPPDAARLEIGSTLAVTAGANTAINWLTQTYITNSSVHSTASNSSRVTPQSTGIWAFTLQTNFSFNSSGLRQARVVDSSGTVIAYARHNPTTSGSQPTTLNLSGSKRFDVVGGYFVAEVNQLDASTLSVVAADTWFDVRKL